MKPRFLFLSISVALFASSLPAKAARGLLAVEGDLTWQSRNDARIPGLGGTDLDLTAFGRGPFPRMRVYAGYKIADKHEIRLLYAPLQVDVQGQFAQPVVFETETFAAATATTIRYRFNSYRVTYAYHFDEVSGWGFAAGFTAKIRDAEIRVTQGARIGSKPNIGFVPLLNLQATRLLFGDWRLRFDFDGLAAPQGRAFDVALFVERPLFYFGSGNTLSAFAGYRTIEGGADNAEVYNFAWIQKAVLGIRGDF